MQGHGLLIQWSAHSSLQAKCTPYGVVHENECLYGAQLLAFTPQMHSWLYHYEVLPFIAHCEQSAPLCDGLWRKCLYGASTLTLAPENAPSYGCGLQLLWTWVNCHFLSIRKQTVSQHVWVCEEMYDANSPQKCSTWMWASVIMDLGELPFPVYQETDSVTTCVSGWGNVWCKLTPEMLYIYLVMDVGCIHYEWIVLSCLSGNRQCCNVCESRDSICFVGCHAPTHLRELKHYPVCSVVQLYYNTTCMYSSLSMYSKGQCNVGDLWPTHLRLHIPGI